MLQLEAEQWRRGICHARRREWADKGFPREGIVLSTGLVSSLTVLQGINAA
jgi:hypothetical protein